MKATEDVVPASSLTMLVVRAGDALMNSHFTLILQPVPTLPTKSFVNYSSQHTCVVYEVYPALRLPRCHEAPMTAQH